MRRRFVKWGAAARGRALVARATLFMLPSLLATPAGVDAAVHAVPVVSAPVVPAASPAVRVTSPASPAVRAVDAAARAASQVAPRAARRAGPRDTAEISTLEAELRSRPGDPGARIRLARAYAGEGMTGRVEDVLRAGLHEASPPDPVRWALVGFLAEERRWSDALAALGPLASTERGREAGARLRVNAGMEAYRAGTPDSARALWEQALRDDATLVAAARNLGALLLEVGARDSARVVVERALVHAPDDDRLLALHTAAIGGRAGLDAAIEAGRAARSRRPGDEALGLRLAQLLAWAGESTAAAALYDTLTARPDASAEAHVSATAFWLARGRRDLAAARAEAGVAAHPGHGTLWQLLGEAEGLGGDWRGAIVAYSRAAALLDEPAPAELGLIHANLAAGDTAAARDAVAALSDRGDAPRDALLQAAEIARALGEWAVAARAYERLLARDPTDARVLEGAAAVAEAEGDRAGALSLYRRALEGEGGAESALGVLRLGRLDEEERRELLRTALWRGVAALQQAELRTLTVLRRSGGTAAARRAEPVVARRDALGRTLTAVLDTVVFETEWGGAELERLREAYPRSTLLERYAARLALERDRPDAAIEVYDRLLARRAGEAGLHLGRARALEALDRLAGAREAYARALELSPEDETAFRALVRLHEREDSLESLLRRVRRLRVRRPDSRTLLDREIELLHRLGRPAEADSVSRTRDTLPPT